MGQAIEFRKMHGLGNDFVVVDARQKPFVPATTQAMWLANRRLGVGCDQLIVLEPSNRADVFMRIYNSDGSEAEACGNATRCVAGLLRRERDKDAKIETLAGILVVRPTTDGMFTVNMGAPIFTPAGIPVDAQLPLNLPKLLEQYPPPMALGMGNPHCIFIVPPSEIEAIDLETLGRQIEAHPLFPAKTNVHFVAKIATNKIRQRVFERGAGITGASGSGACAGAVAALSSGVVVGQVEVVLDGGSLWIDWGGKASDPVFMTGPWAETFQGKIELPSNG